MLKKYLSNKTINLLEYYSTLNINNIFSNDITKSKHRSFANKEMLVSQLFKEINDQLNTKNNNNFFYKGNPDSQVMIMGGFPNDDDVKNQEIFQTIASGDGQFKIETIISTGQITPEDEVYDQNVDELVFLVQGEANLMFVDSNKEICLKKGDSVFIKAHCKHRVTFTSKEPPCVWLAIHGMMNFSL